MAVNKTFLYRPLILNFLLIKGTPSVIDKCIKSRKISVRRTLRAKKGFTLLISNEYMDIIRIKK